MCAQSHFSYPDLSTLSPRDLLADLMPALDGTARERLLERAALRQIRRGQLLVREGEVCAIHGHVIAGAIGMVSVNGHVAPQIVGLLLPGDAFGRIFDGPMPHTLEALTDGLVLEVDRPTLEEVLSASPKAEHALIVSMLDELDAARAWVMILNSAQVVERVAAFLAILGQRQRAPHGTDQTAPLTLRLPLSRKDMARCLGVRAESLSRGMRRLEKAGIIEILTADIVRVPDPDALVQAAGHAAEAALRRQTKTAKGRNGRVA